MAQVNIEIAGRSYAVACRDGEEERLKLLGRLVNTRATDVARAVGHGNEAYGLLLTALLLADELDEARSASGESRLEDESRISAIERCADQLESLVATLEKPTLTS